MKVFAWLLLALVALLFLSAFASMASAQTTSDPPLPDITIGIGPSWRRGDAHAISADVNLAERLGTSNIFHWSTLSTPVARVAAGSPALPSTITTGLAYVIAGSANGALSVLLIGQGGRDQLPTGATSLALTGSIGVPIRIPHTKNLYFMPYVRASKPTAGVDGALVSTIVQPAFMLIYGLNRK